MGVSDVCELAGKLNSHFIGWTSKGHSSTFDSEDPVHEAGIAASDVDEDSYDSADSSDKTSGSSTASSITAENMFCESVQIGAAHHANVSTKLQ